MIPKYIRSLLIAGAIAVLRHARNRPTRDGEWVRGLLARKPTKVAAVALANKTARIVWAVMVRGDGYRAKAVLGQPAQDPTSPFRCEGEEEVMVSGRAADREDPGNSRRNAARSLDWDPTSELHQGQRSYAPHRRAGHMTAPDHVARTTAKNPCTRGPSTYEICRHELAVSTNLTRWLRRCAFTSSAQRAPVSRLNWPEPSNHLRCVPAPTADSLRPLRWPEQLDCW
jgi:hypothetical protein